jgi:hypothetical protein
MNPELGALGAGGILNMAKTVFGDFSEEMVLSSVSVTR